MLISGEEERWGDFRPLYRDYYSTPFFIRLSAVASNGGRVRGALIASLESILVHDSHARERPDSNARFTDSKTLERMRSEPQP